MKKSTKKMVIGIFILFIAAFLISCGGTPSAPPPPASSAAPAATETRSPSSDAPPPAVTPPPPSQTQTTGTRDRNNLLIDGAQRKTVVSGETLSEIARDTYGDWKYFPILLLASGFSDRDIIEPGEIIIIPDLQRNLNDSTARASIMRVYDQMATLMRQRNRIDYSDSLRLFASNL